MPRISPKNQNSPKQIYTGDLFNGGMNTTNHPTIIPLNEFVLLKNVDISGSVLKKRNGWKKITEGWKAVAGNSLKGVYHIDSGFYWFGGNIWYKGKYIYTPYIPLSSDKKFLLNTKNFAKSWEINVINNKIPLSSFRMRDEQYYGNYLRHKHTSTIDALTWIPTHSEVGNSFFYDIKKNKIANYSDFLAQPYELINTLGRNLLDKYYTGYNYVMSQNKDLYWYRINYFIDSFRRSISKEIKNYFPFNEIIYNIKDSIKGTVYFFTLKNKQLPFFELGSTTPFVPKYWKVYNDRLWNSVWNKDRLAFWKSSNSMIMIPLSFPPDGTVQNNNFWEAKIVYKALFDKEQQEELKAYEPKTGASKYKIKEGIFKSLRTVFPNEYNSLFNLSEDMLNSFSTQDSLEIRKKTLIPDMILKSNVIFKKIIDIKGTYYTENKTENVIPNTFFTDEAEQRGFAFFGEETTPVNNLNNVNALMSLTEKDHFSVEFIDVEFEDDEGTKTMERIDKNSEKYNQLAFDVELIGNNNISYTNYVNDATLLGAPTYIPKDPKKPTNLGIKNMNIKQWYLAKYLKYLNSKNKYIKSVNENQLYINNENIMYENFNTNQNFWLGSRLSEKMYVYKESYFNAYGNIPLKKNINRLNKSYSNLTYKDDFDGTKNILKASSENGIKISPYFVNNKNAYGTKTVNVESLNDYIDISRINHAYSYLLSEYRNTMWLGSSSFTDAPDQHYIFFSIKPKKNWENLQILYKNPINLVNYLFNQKYLKGSWVTVSRLNRTTKKREKKEYKLLSIQTRKWYYDSIIIKKEHNSNNFYIKGALLRLELENYSTDLHIYHRTVEIKFEKQINRDVDLDKFQDIKLIVSEKNTKYKFKSAMICFNNKQIDSERNIDVIIPKDNANPVVGIDGYASKLININALKKSLLYEKQKIDILNKITSGFIEKYNFSTAYMKKNYTYHILLYLFDLSVNFIIFSGVMIRWSPYGFPVLFHSYRSDYSYFPRNNTIIFTENEKIITLKKFLSSLIVFTNKNIYYLVYNIDSPEGISGGYFVKRILNAGIGAKSAKSVINFSNFLYFVGTDNRVYRLYNIYSVNDQTKTNMKKIDDKVQPVLYENIKKDDNPFLIEFNNILYLFVNGVCWKHYPDNNDKKGAWTLDTSTLYKDFFNAFVEDNNFYLNTKKGFYLFDKETYFDDSENINMQIVTKSHTLGYPSNLKKFKRVYLNFNSFVNVNEDFKIYTRVKKNNQTIFQ